MSTGHFCLPEAETASGSFLLKLHYLSVGYKIEEIIKLIKFMPSPEQNQQDQEKPKLDLEELQRQMVELQAKVEQAKQEEERKQTEQKEAAIGEKVGEMEQTYAEGKNIEAELENVNSKIATAESALQKFEEVAQQAKEVGLDVSSQLESFTRAMQDEKDRLDSLQDRRAELWAKAQGLTADTEVMGRIQEQAIKENLEKAQETVEETEDPKKKLKLEFKRVSEIIKTEEEKLQELNKERHELFNEQNKVEETGNKEKPSEIEKGLAENYENQLKIKRGEKRYELEKQFGEQDAELFNQLLKLEEENKSLMESDRRINLDRQGNLKPGVEFPSRKYYEDYAPIAEKARMLRAEREELRRRFAKLLNEQEEKWEENGLYALKKEREKIMSEYAELTKMENKP